MFPPQLHQTTAAPHNCQYLQLSSDHPSIHELLFWLGCYQKINRGSSTLHIWPLVAPSCSWAGYVLLFCIVHMCTWTPSNLPLYKLYPNQCVAKCAGASTQQCESDVCSMSGCPAGSKCVPRHQVCLHTEPGTQCQQFECGKKMLFAHYSNYCKCYIFHYLS